MRQVTRKLDLLDKKESSESHINSTIFGVHPSTKYSTNVLLTLSGYRYLVPKKIAYKIILSLFLRSRRGPY